MSGQSMPMSARFVNAAMGAIIGGAGGMLAALVHTEAADTPFPFRILATVMGGFLVIVGGLLILGAILGRKIPDVGGPHRGPGHGAHAPGAMRPPPAAPARGTHVCPHCAKPMGEEVEVSPSGDVKCPFCRSWFNVRG